MEFFRITQMVYQFLHLVGIGLFVVMLIAVLNWPPIRGRGWLTAALVMKLAAGGGYLMLGLTQLLGMFARHGGALSSVNLTQIGYLLLSLIGMAGDGLLVVALLSLAGALRALPPQSFANTQSPWQS